MGVTRVVTVRDHPLFNTYYGMLRRCYTPSNGAYHKYGAKGIRVCAQWRTGDRDGPAEGFWNFIRDMGPRPEGHALGRLDHRKDYSPENCRWEPTSEQRKRQNQPIPWTLEGGMS